MNLLKSFFLGSLTLLILFVSGCKDDDSKQTSGELVLSFELPTSPNGRSHNDINPSSVLVTIIDDSQNEIKNREELELINFGTGFLTDPILLEVGDYQITEFLVLDQNREIVLATPVQGSILENLVSTPLPIDFLVSSDNITEISLEVIETSGIDPEDLGYASLNFNIVPISNILISVFEQSGGKNRFLSSQLTIFGETDSINTVNLGDSINLVKIRSDYQNVSLKFTREGFVDQIINLSQDSLQSHTTSPLLVKMVSDGIDLSRGIIGFYTLDGNANNSEGSGPNGVLGDGNGNNEPLLIKDRNGQMNAAMQFDGSIKYVDLTEDPIYDIGDYSEFSLSLWIDPEMPTDAADIGGIIISKYISASDNRHYNLRILNSNLDFRLHDQGGTDHQLISTPISFSNGWQHVSVVSEGGIVTMYLDGVSVGSFTQTVQVKENSPTAKTLLGAVHFSNTLFDVNYTGKIDDVRIYNRALNDEEIEFLSNN